jgi:ELWxxDGT repeat protein
VHGVELWKTDGTAAGTVLVKDIIPGSNSSSPRRLTDVGGKLFFVASNDLGEPQLWRSDGTTRGTTPVVALAPGDGVEANVVEKLVGVGNNAYFISPFGFFGSTTEYALWESDGTPAGTVKVPTPVEMNLQHTSLFPAAGQLYLLDDAGATLWRSDPPTSAVTRVRTFDGASDLAAIGTLGGRLFVEPVCPRRAAAEVSPSCGRRTAARRGPPACARPGVRPQQRRPEFTRVGDVIFHNAHTANGPELWRVDAARRSHAGQPLKRLGIPGAERLGLLRLRDPPLPDGPVLGPRQWTWAR